MASIVLGTAILEPIPSAGPGRVPLRRRASAPELANLNAIYGNPEEPYQVGNSIRLQHQGSSGRQNRTINARIVRVFAPFSMAAVMVVRVFEPTVDLEGEFVLKVYDQRYTGELRKQYGVQSWSRTRDMKLERRRWSKQLVKFFYKIMADDYIYAGEDEGDTSNDGHEDGDDNQDEEDAGDELFFQTICLKMYRAELEVYRQARQHGIDGTDVPRFIGSVRIPTTYRSKNCCAESANIKGVPGILIQYLPGFPLQALYEKECPPPPRSEWQSLVDEGVRIVHYMTTNMDIRNDDCCPRNTVVHWDPVTQRWKCKLIDFGHCAIRSKGVSDWEWRERQAWQDEEGSIGRHMEVFLRERKKYDYVYEKSQYSLDLSEDFLKRTPGELEKGMNAS
ncbi:hypothetical protein EKO04_006845 [Ascochyta lentis]|uniref:Protein kinase domain-containing protein n=1 Tax=Ascochyta lentis TaxID=205686 RepID=A0A8H7J2B4_9PLEO|nr:hypothetical protein EKO04_006845 [Ascochyta lentis]